MATPMLTPLFPLLFTTVSKLWPAKEIQPNLILYGSKLRKVFTFVSWSFLNYVFKGLRQQQQKYATEIYKAMKPEIFTIWSFAEKV